MQRLKDGTEFTFDGGKDPAQVHFPDGTSGDYSYPADGTVHLHMHNGGETVMSGTGPDAHILTQTTPEGDVFSNFDAQGHPGHVVFHHG
jgi:hypothetical protein